MTPAVDVPSEALIVNDPPDDPPPPLPLEAVAMPLLNNGNLAAVCDTNVVTTASIASGWFNAVFLADPT